MSINEFERWCNAWKLKLQRAKTELIHFKGRPRKKYKNPVQVKVDNIEIQPANAARYLGVIIDDKLPWRTHVKQVETIIAARLSLLRFLNQAVFDSNDKIMINLYKSLVRTVITYGYPVLLTADKKLWDRIQIIRNKAIRGALGLPNYTSVEYIHKLSELPKVHDYAMKLIQRAAATILKNHEITYYEQLQLIIQRVQLQQDD